MSYSWDFGDLTGGTGVNPSHSYLTFGTFNATLTVTDNESFTATTYRHIVVHAPPIASFTVMPNQPTVGTSVAFNARSEEHTSELQSRSDLVCRLLLEKKNRLY